MCIFKLNCMYEWILRFLFDCNRYEWSLWQRSFIFQLYRLYVYCVWMNLYIRICGYLYILERNRMCNTFIISEFYKLPIHGIQLENTVVSRKKLTLCACIFWMICMIWICICNVLFCFIPWHWMRWLYVYCIYLYEIIANRHLAK